MMPTYAAKTTVPIEKSRQEIEHNLARFGATAFAYAWQEWSRRIEFVIGGHQVRIDLNLPEPQAFRVDRRGRRRTTSAIERAMQQAHRQLWRALALVILAKLESVEAGITTLEQEFLAQMVLPDGRTVGEVVEPQLMIGEPPRLLPAPD